MRHKPKAEVIFITMWWHWLLRGIQRNRADTGNIQCSCLGGSSFDVTCFPNCCMETMYGRKKRKTISISLYLWNAANNQAQTCCVRKRWQFLVWRWRNLVKAERIWSEHCMGCRLPRIVSRKQFLSRGLSVLLPALNPDELFRTIPSGCSNCHQMNCVYLAPSDEVCKLFKSLDQFF